MNHQSYTLALLQRRDALAGEARAQFLNRFYGLSCNPTVIFGLSLWLGVLGIDRFFVGDWGKGLLKLFTFGGLYVWWIVDLFLITGRARAKNMAVADAILAEMGGRGDEPA